MFITEIWILQSSPVARTLANSNCFSFPWEFDLLRFYCISKKGCYQSRKNLPSKVLIGNGCQQTFCTCKRQDFTETIIITVFAGNLQVVIMHASHVCSKHLFGLPLRMNCMHRTQFDHAHLDFLSLIIWSHVFWQLSCKTSAKHNDGAKVFWSSIVVTCRGGSRGRVQGVSTPPPFLRWPAVF